MPSPSGKRSDEERPNDVTIDLKEDYCDENERASLAVRCMRERIERRIRAGRKKAPLREEEMEDEDEDHHRGEDNKTTAEKDETEDDRRSSSTDEGEKVDDEAPPSGFGKCKREADASAAATVPPGGFASRSTERDALEDQEDQEDRARASSSYVGGRRDGLGKEEMDEGTEAVHPGDRKPAADPARHGKKVAAPGTDGSDPKAKAGAAKPEPTYVPEIILGELTADPSPDEHARRERTLKLPELAPASIGVNPSPDERAKQERASASLAAGARKAGREARTGMDEQGTDSDSKMPEQQDLKPAAVPELAATEGGIYPSPDERARMGIYARVDGAQTSGMTHNDTGLGHPATSPLPYQDSDVRDFHTTPEEEDLDAAGIGILDISVRPGAVSVGGTASETGINTGSAAPAEEQDRGGRLLTTLTGFVVQPRRHRAPLTASQLLANAPLVDGVAIPEREEQEEGTFIRRHRKAIAISLLLIAIGGGVAGAVTVFRRNQARNDGVDQSVAATSRPTVSFRPSASPRPSALPSFMPTPQPTVQGCGPAPRPSEEQELWVLFCAALPSSCPSLSDVSSPQCTALRWLASDPALSSYSDGQKKERYALVTLYKSTSGLEDDERWTDYRWRECNWPGVTCTSEGLNVLNFGSAKEDPVTKELVYSKKPLLYGGTVPKEVALLANVEHIYMSDCGLNSTIPLEVCKMSSLKNLWLNFNSMTGSLPSCIGNLSKLATLYLGFNKLAGKVPSNVGELKELRYLVLSRNNLAGIIPSNVGELKELQYLELSRNNLAGIIPSNVGELKELQYLELSRNNLAGIIPSNVGELKGLKHIGLSLNDLTGSIPSEMGELSGLEHLDLVDNALTGPIPSEMAQLSSLEWLDLSFNALTGPIPSEMAQLSNLRWLRLEVNTLTGTVPEALCALADTDNELMKTYISTDCLGDPPEIECSCCDWCCNGTMCCAADSAITLLGPLFGRCRAL